MAYAFSNPCRMGFAASLCAVLSSVNPAWGQTETDLPASSSNEPQTQVIISPYIWAASLSGDVGLAGYSAPIHLPFSDIFDHLDVAAMGNVEVVKGRGGGWFDAQYVKTSQQEQVLALPVDLMVKITRLSGGFFYKAAIIPLGGETATGSPRTLSFEPTIGLRWTQLAIRASAPVIQTRKKARWTDPVIGARINADLSRHWNLFVKADAGGFGAASTLSVNGEAYLGYRAMLAGRPAILRLGYRYIKQDYDRPDFTGAGRFIWDTEQKGPVVGLSMIF